MSRDSLKTIAADLALYLRQQQETGIESVFDEGPPAHAPGVEVVAAGSTAAAKAPPAPAPPVKTPSAPTGAEDFQARCDRFVHHSLAMVRKFRTTPAAVEAPDIFAAPSEETPIMTRDEKAAALQAMSAEVAACTACKLHPGRTKTVFGAGDPDAGLLLIGEAPGRDEDLQGEPFVGRSGKLLTEILKAIDFAREDVYICNILKCRPPQNRDPERDEVDSCEPFLKRQLEIIQPKVILCLGRHAAMTLLQTRSSLRAMRETVHIYEGIPVMATFHPAALLRNPNWKRDTWDDVRKLKALYTELIAED